MVQVGGKMEGVGKEVDGEVSKLVFGRSSSRPVCMPGVIFPSLIKKCGHWPQRHLITLQS